MGHAYFRRRATHAKGSLIMRHSAMVLALLAAAACGGPQGPKPQPSAFTAADGRAGIGRVAWRKRGDALEVRFSLGGLTPGRHGVHLHANPVCEGPAFQSAGPHYNPEGKKHGHANPDGPHRGDLGNIQVRDSGSGDYVLTAPGVIVPPAGLALVVHAQEDDERADPAGNAGPRVFCAIVK